MLLFCCLCTKRGNVFTPYTLCLSQHMLQVTDCFFLIYKKIKSSSQSSSSLKSFNSCIPTEFPTLGCYGYNESMFVSRVYHRILSTKPAKTARWSKPNTQINWLKTLSFFAMLTGNSVLFFLFVQTNFWMLGTDETVWKPHRSQFNMSDSRS